MIQRTLLVAVAMVAVALSGCTSSGGSDPLSITGTIAEEPIAGISSFSAPKGWTNYSWNFGDGSGEFMGRAVEHTFGFTDGTVTVRLTALKGGVSETVRKDFTLGTGKNLQPVVAMAASSEWVTPGTPVTLDTSMTTDGNNDPIVVKWTCKALGQPGPPTGSHAHGAAAGVPFGISVLAVLDVNLTGGTSIDGDMCESFGTALTGVEGKDQTVTGSFAASGVYEIDVHIRDPKSKPQIARHTIFVTDTLPDEVTTFEFSGTLLGGANGQLQDLICTDQGEICDEEHHAFQLALGSYGAKITFAPSGIVMPPNSVTWGIFAGGSPIVQMNSEATMELGVKQLVENLGYTIVVQTNLGVNVSYTLKIENQNILYPYTLYEPPTAVA